MQELSHESLEDIYGFLFEKELIGLISEVGVYKKLKEGQVLIDYGSYIKHMPLLIDGSIKIFREDPDRGELLLYFIERGDTCAMTMSCCLGGTKSTIKAVAELETEIILLPVEKMEDWLKFASWRKFVFESYNNRLNEMLQIIDTLAFLNMDERLVKYLRQKVIYTKNAELNISHSEIADELNTSRVVISRLLKKLEGEGVVSLHRGRLTVNEF